ncbi:MAG: DUF3520 domain-containing protein [Pirellulales bacterium]|nr:DUF3520 domain-containing protein [Pirellulales bacterium]
MAVHVDVAACPWHPGHRLARIELKGQVLSEQERPTAQSDELLIVRLRFKCPDAAESQELSLPGSDSRQTIEEASLDFRFAAAVACYGMLLRESEYKGDATFDLALALANSGKGEDASGYRGEFIEWVQTAKVLMGR